MLHSILHQPPFPTGTSRLSFGTQKAATSAPLHEPSTRSPKSGTNQALGLKRAGESRGPIARHSNWGNAEPIGAGYHRLRRAATGEALAKGVSWVAGGTAWSRRRQVCWPPVCLPQQAPDGQAPRPAAGCGAAAAGFDAGPASSLAGWRRPGAARRWPGAAPRRGRAGGQA